MEYLQYINTIKDYFEEDCTSINEVDVKNAVVRAIKENTNLLRNVLYKNIAKIVMNCHLDVDIENILASKKFVEAELLTFVVSQTKKKSNKNEISQNFLAKIKADSEWLNIFLKASLLFPENKSLNDIVIDVLEFCNSNNPTYLFSFAKLCKLRKDDELLKEAISNCITSLPLNDEFKFELLEWLHSNSMKKAFIMLSHKLIAISKQEDSTIKKLTDFFVKINQWELVILYCRKVLLNNNFQPKSAITSFVSARLIYAYIKEKNFDEIEPIYKKYWVEQDRVFPFTGELLQSCHFIYSGEEILKNLCDKINQNEKTTYSYQKAIQAKKLEYIGNWREAYKIWSDVILEEPNNPAYLRFIALNIIQNQKRPRKARNYGERLSNINGYEKLGVAIIAISNKGKYNELINDILRFNLHLAKGDIIYDLLIKEFIPTIWNTPNKWSLFLEKNIIDAQGNITHPELVSRIDFIDRFLIGKYIELNAIIDNSSSSKSNDKQFINIFKMVLRLELSTSHLRALLTIINAAEKKYSFFKRDEFGDYQFSEVKQLRNSFLWLLAKRAEFEYLQKGVPESKLESEISRMELHNAESILKKINR